MTVATRTQIHLPSKRIRRNSAYLTALRPFTGVTNQPLQNESQQTHTHTHTHTHTLYLLVFLEIAATFILRHSGQGLKLTTRVHLVQKLSGAIPQLPYMPSCRAEGQLYKLLYDNIDTARFVVHAEWLGR